MNKIYFYTIFIALIFALPVTHAQDGLVKSFKDTRVINTHSVETLPKRKLDIRIGHRFGDLAGDRGGTQTFFGLENASDVMIGGEYGFTNKLTAGIYRTKGAGSLPGGTPGLRQLLNLVGKYRILHQKEDDSMPFSLTVLGLASMSTAKRIETNPDIINNFPEFSHRMAYAGQLLIARKFSDGFSLQIIPSYVHRNLVSFEDDNGIFSMGLASRIQISKVIGLIFDATFPFSEMRTAGNGFYHAIGVGLEFETGGHVFQINFTNATAVMETDYIPYTTSNWGEGEFRLGFTVSRTFNL